MEVITLVNDGTGLGFGIIGGKSTGVVVKTILPGGVADRVTYCFLPVLLLLFCGTDIGQEKTRVIETLYGIEYSTCPCGRVVSALGRHVQLQ